MNRMINEATVVKDPYKYVNLALVIVWVFRVWLDTNPRTIFKCSTSCRFQFPGDASAKDENAPLGLLMTIHS